MINGLGRRAALGILVGLGLGSLAFADSIVFNSPSGNLGSTTHTYTLDGVSFVATGFNGGNLFGKDAGGGENGLGLVQDPSGDDEIFFRSTGTQDFIQLDVLNLLKAGFNNFQFQMGSTTGDEGWSVSACATSGTDCFTSPVTGSSENVHSVPVTLSATNHYLDFSATEGNVLLGLISATSSVPEPRFYGVLLVGMLALVGIVLRKRHATEQA